MIVSITNPYRFAPRFLTVSPEPGSGGSNVSCDGRVARAGVNETFATIRGGSGNNQSETDTVIGLFLQASTTTNQYQILRRVGLTFDTRSIPADATILSVTLKLYGQNKLANLGQTDVVVCEFNPANPADFAGSDYKIAQWPSTSYARMSWLAWSTTGYNVFSLPTTAVTKAGITTIGLRLGWDFDNTTGMAWSSNAITGFYLYAADNGSNVPILEVEWQ